MPTVLITGAGSGLGRELAVEFSKKGYDLVLVSNTFSNFKGTEKIIENKKIRVHYFKADISKLTRVRQIKKKLEDKRIPIDILINNAGIGDFGNIRDKALGQITRMMQVNYFGSAFFTTEFLCQIINRKGTIVYAIS